MSYKEDLESISQGIRVPAIGELADKEIAELKEEIAKLRLVIREIYEYAASEITLTATEGYKQHLI